MTARKLHTTTVTSATVTFAQPQPTPTHNIPAVTPAYTVTSETAPQFGQAEFAESHNSFSRQGRIAGYAC